MNLVAVSRTEVARRSAFAEHLPVSCSGGPFSVYWSQLEAPVTRIFEHSYQRRWISTPLW